MGSKKTGDIFFLSSLLEMAGKLSDCREMKIFHNTTKLCVRKEQQVGRKVMEQ